MTSSARALCQAGALVLALVGAPAAQAADRAGLSDLMDEAISVYPGMAAARNTVRASHIEVTAARHAYGPTLAISTQVNRVGYERNTQGATGGNIPTATVSLTQGLWGGGIKAGLRRAKDTLKAADYAVAENATALKQRVLGAYINWKRLHDRSAALVVIVDLQQQWVANIDRRMGEGVASLADVKLAQSRLSQVKSDLAANQAMENAAVDQISGLVGRGVLASELARLDTAAPVLAPDCGHIVDAALEVSPQLGRMRYEAAAAQDGADQAFGQSLPQLGVQVQRVWGSPTTPSWPAFTSYGLVLSYAPGAGFSGLSLANASRVRAKGAGMEVAAAEIDLRNAVDNQCASYEAAKSREIETAHSAALSEEIYESYTNQYKAGKRTVLDLLNILREREQAELSEIDVSNEILQYRWQLFIMTDPSILQSLGEGR